MSENKDLPKPTEEKEDDPDGYIRTIASTWGHVDLIKEWLPHHQGDPAKITDNVLIPAAMYGQLEILKMAIEYGKQNMARYTMLLLAEQGYLFLAS